jgi:signal transduction histidine kinase
LFMVAKEALNNVAKHANASELRIKLELSDRELRLMIHDNGSGFSPSKAAESGHGLRNMETRLRDLGGEFQIKSAPGEGTTIYVSIRLPKR